MIEAVEDEEREQDVQTEKGGSQGCCVRLFSFTALLCGGGERDGEKSLAALYLVFILTSSFTIAQFIGATIANSLSMYGDCFTMAIDSVTYMLNIYAEHKKLRRPEDLSEESLRLLDINAQQLDTKVAFVSGAALVAVTLYIMYDAVKRLESEIGIAPVNPQIMYGFSAVNLLMNIVSCLAFFRVNDSFFRPDSPEESCGANASSSRNPESSLHRSLSASFSNEMVRRESAATLDLETSGWSNLNVLSAFVHLAADTLRSITVSITSLYVWIEHGDSVRADAIGSLIVCSLVLLASVFLFYETNKRRYDVLHLEQYQHVTTELTPL